MARRSASGMINICSSKKPHRSVTNRACSLAGAQALGRLRHVFHAFNSSIDFSPWTTGSVCRALAPAGVPRGPDRAGSYQLDWGPDSCRHPMARPDQLGRRRASRAERRRGGHQSVGPGQPITLSGTAAVHSVNTGYLALTITAGGLTIGPGQSQFGGPVTLNGGTIIPLDGASITAGNIYGLTPFTIPAGVTLGMQNASVYGPFANLGTLDVTGQVQLGQLGQLGGNGITDTNSGTLNVTSGNTLSIGGPAFTFITSGTVTVANGGTLQATTGQYVQSAGTTTVNGTMTAGPVLQGGVLAGTGTVAGFSQTGGTVSPGDPAGVLTINGNYTESGGTLAIALNGPAASSQGELNVSGSVTLGGALGLAVGYVAGPGDTFVIVDNGGSNPVSGTFTGLPEGATLTAAGQTFRISYVGGDGNDVVLTRLGSATDAIWDGAPDGGGTSTDANWTTASNWVGDVAPVPGDDLYFPAAAAKKANVDTFLAGTAFDSITYTGSDYDISGSGIAVSDGIRDSAASGDNRFDPDITLTASQTFGVAAAGETLFLGGVISGNAGVNLSKEAAGATSLNAGTLVFDGTTDNTFSGTLTVNGGTLELNKTGAVAAAGPLVIGDGVGTDAVTELSGDQIGDTAAVTVNANGQLSAAFGDTIGALAFNAGGSLNTGASALTVTGQTAITGSAAADALEVTGMSPFVASLNGTMIGPIVARGGVTFDGAGGNDTLIGPNADATWTITGANAGQLGGPIAFGFANVENLTGGSGNDMFAFAPAGSVVGMIDGGGGTNGLDYSAFTTPIQANLGIDITASAYLSSPIDPQYPFPDTGTAALTYHAATGTFDLTATISQESSSSVQPFELSGPNGPILDLLTVPGAKYSLTGNIYFTFTYSATDVSLPPADEAALFTNQVTIGGYATGLLRVQTQTASATGPPRAPAASPISPMSPEARATTASSAVSATTSCAAAMGTTPFSAARATTPCAAEPEVTRSTGAVSDGSDKIDGGAGNETVVMIGSSGTTGDAFSVQPGAGGRLAVGRNGQTTLDIGGVESLSLSGSNADNDTFTIDNLAGVSDLTSVNVYGNAGPNVFDVTPSPNVTINIFGGAPPPTFPFVRYYHGTLNVATAGTTNPALQVSVLYGPGMFGPNYSDPYLSGAYAFADRQPVNFIYVAAVTPVSGDPAVVTSSVGDVNAGGQVTYTVVVSNTNPSLPAGVPESGIVVSDQFPARCPALLTRRWSPAEPRATPPPARATSATRSTCRSAPRSPTP